MPDTKKKRKYTAKTKSGGRIQVSEKSVKDAKKKTGVFKERPAYKGKLVKNKKGRVTGMKKHDGSYKMVTNPVAEKKARKALIYDRKLHKADSLSHSKRIKTFATAKRKKS